MLQADNNEVLLLFRVFMLLQHCLGYGDGEFAKSLIQLGRGCNSVDELVSKLKQNDIDIPIAVVCELFDVFAPLKSKPVSVCHTRIELLEEHELELQKSINYEGWLLFEVSMLLQRRLGYGDIELADTLIQLGRGSDNVAEFISKLKQQATDIPIALVSELLPMLAPLKSDSVSDFANEEVEEHDLQKSVDWRERFQPFKVYKDEETLQAGINDLCFQFMDVPSPPSIQVLNKIRAFSNAEKEMTEAEDAKIRRKVKKWSEQEVDALKEGVERYGEGSWKMILHSKRDIFERRTAVDLKDKWRNLIKKEQQQQNKFNHEKAQDGC